MFSLLCPFVTLVVSHFCFADRTSVLFASVPGHCLPFTFSLKSCSNAREFHDLNIDLLFLDGFQTV